MCDKEKDIPDICRWLICGAPWSWLGYCQTIYPFREVCERFQHPLLGVLKDIVHYF
jgi:hypothetical protein